MSDKRHVGKTPDDVLPTLAASSSKKDDSSTIIFSFKRHSMDYFTINGIKRRTGLDDPIFWYILVIKELLDNAIDFLQTHYKGYSGTHIIVYITKINNSILHIKIRNTNSGARFKDGSDSITVFQNIDKIFYPEMTYGSKQNLKIISRGLLGDAMKRILGLAYILIHLNDDKTAFANAQWNQPLIIRHNGLETHVRAVVDPRTGGSLDIREAGVVQGRNKDTEIELFLPLLKEHMISMHEIEQYCRAYPILTTDTAFEFILSDEITADKKMIEYPAHHAISAKWNNANNVWCYYPEEFSECFTSVDDDESITVYDVLRTFREGNTLKKTDDIQISIKEFLSNPDYHKKIEAYYHELRRLKDPPQELSLPYGTGKERKQALVSRVYSSFLTGSEYEGLLDYEKAVYRPIRGFFNDRYLRYPFAIEALAIPYKRAAFSVGSNVNYHTKIVGTVNYSLSPTANEFERDEGDEYKWTNDAGWTIESKSMRDIFDELGFRFDLFYHQASTKVPAVIFVNLISPRIDYHGQSKSKIDTHPFEDELVEIAKRIAKSMPSFQQIGLRFKGKEHGHKLDSSNRNEDQGAREYLYDFLSQRWIDVNRDPSLIVRDRLTQSGVWYRIRPDMIIGGFKPKTNWGKTRKYITGIIEEVCLEISKGTAHREDFGIVAAARAIMYYKGKQIPLKFDNFKTLAKNGVAVVVIEKEGIPEVLAEHAAKYGVALVNTRGRLTRYGIAFIEEVKALGSIVTLFVDYDAVGQDILNATKTKTHVIGVNKETIAWFQQNGFPNLTVEDVQEEYELSIETDDEYLQRYRIEIDSIMAKVGAEAFWKYVVHRLELKEFSPNGFDYSDGEVLSMPESEDLYFEEMNELIDLFDDYIEDITEDERNKITDNELKAADKLIEVEPKEKEIKERLIPIVANDRIMKLAAPRLKTLTDEIRKEIDKEIKAAAA